MSFREHIEKMPNLVRIKKKVSTNLEASAVINELADKPVLFENIKESEFKVCANIFPTKQSVADYLGCKVDELIPTLTKAIENPTKPKIVEKAPCQEVEMKEIDLDKIPILFHLKKDGGKFITSGVVIAKHPKYGQNLDFHRSMQIAKNKFSIRIVKNRHFDTFLNEQKKMPMAICIGNGAEVLNAAATSVEIGQNELEIANTLKPIRVVKAKTFDAYIPADCEFVLEGTIDLEELADEGPFVDLTETQDIIRQQPVFTVTKITHRKDAIWQALLPGKLEHKILMGMPREPTIFKKVNEAGVKCLDVNVNPGGCSWLHARVQIDKQTDEDGKKAIEAAFEGHKSCKHVFIVDKDIDIYNDQEVEWAMATRFQAHKRIVIHEKEKGSSLDPSAKSETHYTTKAGFDLTAKLHTEGKNFSKAEFPKANLEDYLE
ncbi:MAG: UbiD family decarboxylase [archaeon]|nr:UbiD family decarboxylase [archaeon]